MKEKKSRSNKKWTRINCCSGAAVVHVPNIVYLEYYLEITQYLCSKCFRPTGKSLSTDKILQSMRFFEKHSGQNVCFSVIFFHGHRFGVYKLAIQG